MHDADAQQMGMLSYVSAEEHVPRAATLGANPDGGGSGKGACVDGLELRRVQPDPLRGTFWRGNAGAYQSVVGSIAELSQG